MVSQISCQNRLMCTEFITWVRSWRQLLFTTNTTMRVQTAHNWVLLIVQSKWCPQLHSSMTPALLSASVLMPVALYCTRVVNLYKTTDIILVLCTCRHIGSVRLDLAQSQWYCDVVSKKQTHKYTVLPLLFWRWAARRLFFADLPTQIKKLAVPAGFLYSKKTASLSQLVWQPRYCEYTATVTDCGRASTDLFFIKYHKVRMWPKLTKLTWSHCFMQWWPSHTVLCRPTVNVHYSEDY